MLEDMLSQKMIKQYDFIFDWQGHEQRRQAFQPTHPFHYSVYLLHITSYTELPFV